MILDLKGGSLIGVHIVLDRGDEITNGTLHECVINDVLWEMSSDYYQGEPTISSCTLQHCRFLSWEEV